MHIRPALSCFMRTGCPVRWREFHYTDKDGREKILYHNGYVNYTEAMHRVIEPAGIENVDTVLVTGYSAGGWGAALLADDIYTNYFPKVNVWQTPDSISDKIVSGNLTMDCLRSLHVKYGGNIHLLYGGVYSYSVTLSHNVSCY